MITLKDALSISCLEKATILSGANGINRIIKSVTVTDVPDFYQWLKGNELILTTGFGFQGDISSLEKMIERLNDAGASGLAIKFNRYLDSLPPSVLNISNELNFPILSYPYDLSWTDVINPIMEQIVNVQTKKLERSDLIRHRLIEQILHNGGLKEISQILSDFVKNPVTIIEPVYSTVYSTLNYHFNINEIKFDKYWMNNESETINPIQSSPEIYQIKGEHSRIVVPIRAGDITTGYIITWEKNQPFCEDDIIPLEQGTIIAALEIEKLEAIRRTKRSYRNDLLRRIIEDEVLDFVSAKLLAKELGWSLYENYFVVALSIFKKEDKNKSNKSIYSSFWEVKERLVKNLSPILEREILLGVDRKNEIIFLFPNKQENLSYQESIQSLNREIKLLLNQIDINYDYHIGVGRYYKGYNGIKLSYKEAIDSINIGPNLKKASNVTNYSDLGVYRLLNQNLLKEEMTKFLNDTIGPLFHEKDKLTEHIETLKVFLETGGNYRQTAKRLFLHHNTVRYRILMISKLCKLDFKNEDDKLNVAICLKLIQLIEP